MSNLLILNIQATMAVCIYVLIYRVYLRDWFNARDFGAAVLPLLILHSFRYLGLTMLVTGQMAPEIPRDALQIMAYGDFAAGFTALIAAIAIACKLKTGSLLVFVFTIVGVADLIIVGPTAFNAGVFDADIGIMWFLLVVYAPSLLLSHIYIILRLRSHCKSCEKTDQNRRKTK